MAGVFQETVSKPEIFHFPLHGLLNHNINSGLLKFNHLKIYPIEFTFDNYFSVDHFLVVCSKNFLASIFSRGEDSLYAMD